MLFGGHLSKDITCRLSWPLVALGMTEYSYQALKEKSKNTAKRLPLCLTNCISTDLKKKAYIPTGNAELEFLAVSFMRQYPRDSRGERWT